MGTEENRSAERCCGGSNQDSGVSCGCGGASQSKSKLRLIIFGVIMLAAVGVGAYSLVAKSTTVPCSQQNCSSAGGNCCPSTSK